MPMVLAWDPRPAIQVADKLKEKAQELDAQTHNAAVTIDNSYTFWRGSAGEAARDRAAQDRDNARRSKEVLIGIQQEIYKQIAFIVDYIDVIKDKKAEAEESEYDLFVRDDGGVDSRMSNIEVLARFGPTGLTEKEGYELYLTATIRSALRRIQETDEEGSEAIRRWLEELADDVKRGVTVLPTDPKLAEILADYQTSPSEDGAQLWPSGSLLDSIRLIDPSFQPTLMTEEEVLLLTARAAQPDGIKEVYDFFQIRSEAEEAAKAAYPGEDNPALADGHGDAYRHMYWNALMTQRYGEEWTAQFGTAHEGIGANAPAREAMDLYNNELGRQIAVDNPDASPEELAQIVQQKIDNGEAIVVNSGQQIDWSNRVGVGENVSPPSVDIPLPTKE
ncbi:hypothetical protein IU468_28320 [Nocardia farcinica]|nr:hypothetical protein [Nocardia farcinica]MBF6231827.1 hypothetical protein [Nocardia farcinica]MBF6260172.1 hypothetical protein [Nocardia farcinica]